MKIATAVAALGLFLLAVPVNAQSLTLRVTMQLPDGVATYQTEVGGGRILVTQTFRAATFQFQDQDKFWANISDIDLAESEARKGEVGEVPFYISWPCKA